MTLRYTHLAPSHKVKAVDILDSTINETPTIQKLYKMKGAMNEYHSQPLDFPGGPGQN
jgi:hypothetical protein